MSLLLALSGPPRHVRLESAFRCKAEDIGSHRVFRLLTQSGHREAEWSGLRRCFRLRSPCDENTADALEHRLAFLISRVDLATKDSRIRPRLGLAFLQDHRFQIEFVARTDRVRLPHLIVTQPSKRTARPRRGLAISQISGRIGTPARCSQQPDRHLPSTARNDRPIFKGSGS
jgi:hypothetical protein